MLALPSECVQVMVKAQRSSSSSISHAGRKRKVKLKARRSCSSPAKVRPCKSEASGREMRRRGLGQYVIPA